MISSAAKIGVIGVTLALALPFAPDGAAEATTNSQQITHVTVGLKPAHPHLIRRLSHQHGVAQAQRVQLLRQATARPAVTSRIDATARSAGAHVVGRNLFSVTYGGAPSALQSFAAAEQSNPEVSYVVQDSGKPLWHPMDSTLGPATARQVYDAPAGISPSASEPTVATIQFSGWDSADLSTYAQDLGVPDPVASGQYTSVSVDGASTTLPDGTGGEMEVAMDQETILGLGPKLNQRAYFAPATGSGGLIDALNQIATDALDATHNYYGLAALSISWGSCEEAIAAAGGDFTALDDAIANVLAAGVTIFAATGDSGGFDCAPFGVNSPAVDFPASDPLVVAVGGTTLSSTSPVSEQAWSYDPQTGAGSGGGVSKVFYEPSYQKPFATTDGRIVPDIALDADPNSGADVYADGSWMVGGGTSLASPLAAATFTDLLAANDFDYGIGWIHPNIYGAGTGFRDITAGSNGVFAATRGFDMVTGLGAPQWRNLSDALIGSPTVSVPAFSHTRRVPISVASPQGMRYDSWTAGTDTEPADCGSTGLTTKPTSVQATHDGRTHVWVIGNTYAGWCYVGDATTFVDTATPTVSIAVRHDRSRATVRWSNHDPAPSSGLKIYAVDIHRVGMSRAIYRRATTKHRASFKIVRGSTYRITVKATDRAGNAGTQVRRFTV